MTDKTPIVAKEGWHALHLFYKIEHGQWDLFSREEQVAAKTALSTLVQEIRAAADTQLLTCSVVTPKADLAFLLLTPDLRQANAFEKRLTRSLGADVLTPVFSYLSVTERSEYFSTEADHVESLKKERGLAEGSAEFDAALAEIRDRLEKYASFRLYPQLPDWPVVCFYPMSKRRGDVKNWYSLPFAERKRLMSGHARIGREWHGRILQMITASTGLDDGEWGVTLFAHNSADVKDIVHQMRFDEVSAEYAEFGEFFIGLQAPLDELFARLLL